MPSEEELLAAWGWTCDAAGWHTPDGLQVHATVTEAFERQEGYSKLPIANSSQAVTDYCWEHSRCPRCNSAAHSSTYVQYIIPSLSWDGRVTNAADFCDRNRVICSDCGWSGITHELAPDDQ